jgi:hypothetical protein
MQDAETEFVLQLMQTVLMLAEEKLDARPDNPIVLVLSQWSDPTFANAIRTSSREVIEHLRTLKATPIQDMFVTTRHD